MIALQNVITYRVEFAVTDTLNFGVYLDVMGTGITCSLPHEWGHETPRIFYKTKLVQIALNRNDINPELHVTFNANIFF